MHEEPKRYEEHLVPQPCTVQVERAVDDAATPVSRYDVWKIGGFPRWQVVDAQDIRCDHCGEAMDLLFTASSGDETGIDIGRAGELRIFRCPGDAGHGVRTDVH